MDAEFWNDRYRTEAYVYGTAPNRFVQQQADRWAAGGAVLVLRAVEAVLDEGAHHRGPAAVVRFVWQRPVP